MSASLDIRVHALDAKTLTPLVQKAIARSTGRIVHWIVEQVRVNTVGGGMGPGSVYRVSGVFEDAESATPWSLILKVVASSSRSDETRSQSTLEIPREAEFYASKFADHFPAGFRAARCYAVSKQAGDAGQTEYWLWLETLTSQQANSQQAYSQQGSLKSSWTLDDHYHLARGLGLLNGSFLTKAPLLAVPWLDSNGIRTYLERAAPMVAQLIANRHLPLVERAFPRATVDSFLAMWQAREEHLQTLAKLPQTLCHGDAQVSNLFLLATPDKQPETGVQPVVGAIDWSHAGSGAVGCDPAQLLSFSLATGKVDVSQAAALDQAIFDGYVAGFQATGWQGDPKVLRLGYTASALRSRTTAVRRALPPLIDSTAAKQAEQRLQAQGITLDNVLNMVSQSNQFFEALFHESLELRDQLQWRSHF